MVAAHRAGVSENFERACRFTARRLDHERHAAGANVPVQFCHTPGVGQASPYQGLMKMKAAPMAMNPKPTAELHWKGSFRYTRANTANTAKVMTSWMVFS